jgi:glycine betaine/proline transport system permease protein/glycine betaine/proline transport system substrate-binding protein
METWTDNIATYDEDVESGAIIELGLNYGDNEQGFYVPRYVIEGDAERGIEAMAPDLKSVEDLANYSDVFVDPDDPSMGRIYGAISGWAIDEIMKNKVAYYGLDEYYNYIDPVLILRFPRPFPPPMKGRTHRCLLLGTHMDYRKIRPRPAGGCTV